MKYPVVKKTYSPDEAGALIVLAEKIILRHSEAGVNSPLGNSLIADLHYRVSIARAKHDEGEKYKKLMEDAFRERDLFLGLGRTDDGLGCTLQKLVSRLDDHYGGTPGELKKWGLGEP